MDDIGTIDHLHPLIECMHLGFDDATSYVTDLDFNNNDNQDDGDDNKTAKNNKSSLSWLLDDDRISKRVLSVYDNKKANAGNICKHKPTNISCTVSFQVVDKEGNAVSFVNSNYMGFGTGIVPKKCGFTLHNRGYGFSLNKNHPNVYEPNKRPYHTIIPGIITHRDTNELYASISNMGAFMQPPGHLQLTVALVAAGLDPQSAIDMPRFRITGGGCGNPMDSTIDVEDGFDNNVIDKLKEMGHLLTSHATDDDSDDGSYAKSDTTHHFVKGFKRTMFGRAQIIKRDRETGVLWAGSDGRADGCAMGY